MLARHPLTGKDIRIISLDTSIWKENKSLVWLDSTCTGAAWSRYDIGVTSVEEALALKKEGLQADLILCLGDVGETVAWCESGEWSKARIVAVPKSFVEFMGFERLMKLRMGNIICIDEIHELYPFVGAKWDGTVADAKILMAAVLQVQRTFPIESSPSQRKIEGLRILETREEPQPLWFITQYYVPEKGARRGEIQACLTKNLECPLIDKIVLLNEKACAPAHKKIEEHVIQKRLTYADVIHWIYEKVPPNTMVAFANADIFLHGDSWRGLWSTDLETQAKFLALLRWDVESVDSESIDTAKVFSNKGQPRVDSQDTWVLSSNSVKAVTWDWDALNFPFGKGGCDNSITVEMFKKRFVVANPSLTMKTYHLHSSGIRGYNPADIVDKPVYLYIQATGLHDKKPVLDYNSVAEPHTFKFTPFERRLAGPLSASQARTFCTMVGRSTQGEVTIEVDGANLWAPPPVSLYSLQNVFQTRDGLVYTQNSLFVGKTRAAAKAWSESTISYLSPSIGVKDALIAPLPDAVASVPSRFILDYMSKVFLLRQEFGLAKGEFWCSKQESCVEALKMFSWGSHEIPVLSRDENHQAWCSNAVVWPQQEEGTLISREEIEALRKALVLGWKEAPEKTLVIVVDSKWVTDDVAENLQIDGLRIKILWAGRTSLDTSLNAFRGAWGVILFDISLSQWLWALPRGAFVWEIQSGMSPSIHLLHLCAAAELKHRLTIVPKNSNDFEKKALTEKLLADMKLCFEPEVPLKPVSKNEKPKLFMPKGHSGFYAHAGDSFREVARLWAERGYVDLIPSSSHQVWLHGVGDTLLYDRPTHQWLEQAPPNERTFRRALFGNPAPAPGGSPWSFWPRRPALVEAAVADLRPWESRDQSVVFYGRSENAVQKSRRSTDWSAACSEFIHVDGLSKYPYTAEEYLERLAKSRYGLCLAGYGFKCHREIECMAMGTVPIVAPEVDMESYAEPPEEGLHYLRVAKPEDVAPLVKNITAERWTMMSAACRDWWRRNASVDGMWALTQSLV